MTDVRLPTSPGRVLMGPRNHWKVIGKDNLIALAECAGDRVTDDSVLVLPCEYNLNMLRKYGFKFDSSVADSIKKLEAKAASLREAALDEEPIAAFPFLNPWQRSGVRWLLLNRRSILTDQLRMGKTLTTLCAAELIGGRKLIVCSKGLVGWWAKEIREKLGQEAFLWELPRKGSPDGFYIIHYNVLHRPRAADAIVQCGFKTLITDEAHRVKGRKSTTYKLFQKICSSISNVFFATGTPVDGKAEELYALLNLIDKWTFSSFWRFARMFTHVTIDNWGMRVGRPRNLEVLSSVLDLHQLSRSKQFNEVHTQAVTVELSDLQRKLYDEMFKTYQIEIEGGDNVVASGALARETRLQQIVVWPHIFLADSTITPRLDVALDLTYELMSEGKNVVLFTQFRKVAAYLQQQLNAFGLHGGSRDDPQIVAESIIREQIPVVATYAYGSEGFGLHGASCMILVDLPWKSIQLRQALGRITGPLQTKPCEYYFLTAPGTVDEEIWELVDGKQDFNEWVVRARLLGKKLHSP